jgi:hypothetical protein
MTPVDGHRVSFGDGLRDQVLLDELGLLHHLDSVHLSVPLVTPTNNHYGSRFFVKAFVINHSILPTNCGEKIFWLSVKRHFIKMHFDALLLKALSQRNIAQNQHAFCQKTYAQGLKLEILCDEMLTTKITEWVNFGQTSRSTLLAKATKLRHENVFRDMRNKKISVAPKTN